MQIPRDAVLLRIFIGESDKWEHKPLYEAIVLKARETHLADQPSAHGKNFAALARPAHRHGNRGQRRENQRFSAGARLDVQRRTRYARKSKGAALSFGQSPDGTAVVIAAIFWVAKS